MDLDPSSSVKNQEFYECKVPNEEFIQINASILELSK
jgi:hypothetical protein